MEEILSVQGIKSTNQRIHLTGDRRDDALPKARRAPPWQGRENPALAASGPRFFQGHVFAAVRARGAPGFGLGVIPRPPFPWCL